jgi:hypothetical protein
MPFQYTPYRNQYVGSITDLMGRGRDAEAQALITAANAQAQAAQVSGQAWGGAVQGIGDIVSQGITNWNSPEARQQRELDEARKVYDEGAREVREVTDNRFVGSSIGPSILPGTPSRPKRYPISETAVPFSGEGPRSLPSSKPTLPTTETYGPGTIKPYIEQVTREVRGYLSDGGFFDPRRAIDKMVEAGTDTNVINKLMSELHANNVMLASYDAIETKSAEDQTVLLGRLAATALEQAESGVLDVNAAIALNLGPLEERFTEEAVNDLRVKLFELSPEQQTAALTDAVKAADNILGYTNIGPGEGRIGISGIAQVPVTDLDLAERIRATGVSERQADQRMAEVVRSALVNEGLAGGRLDEAIRSALVNEGLAGERLEEAIRGAGVDESLAARRQTEVERAAGVGEDLSFQRLEQGTRSLDQADISQAALEAWRARTSEETERNNRAGTAQGIERLRLDAQAIGDRRRESLIRYPPAGQMVTDAQGFTSIPDALESLGLTPTPPEKQLYNRINMWVTGPVSGIPKSGELIGWAQETGATVTALKLVTNVIATALQRNPRLPEGERERVLESLDLMPGLLTNPRSLHTRMRVVDDLLRGMLSGTHPLDDQASVLRAIDLLGVPQERARIDSLLVPQEKVTAEFNSRGEPVR